MSTLHVMVKTGIVQPENFLLPVCYLSILFDIFIVCIYILYTSTIYILVPISHAAYFAFLQPNIIIFQPAFTCNI